MIEFVEKTSGKIVREVTSERSLGQLKFISNSNSLKITPSERLRLLNTEVGDFIKCDETDIDQYYLIKRKDFVVGLFSGRFAIKQ